MDAALRTDAKENENEETTKARKMNIKVPGLYGLFTV